MSLGLGSLTTFIFYQWTQRCVAGSTGFASAFALLVVIGSLCVVTFLIMRLARTPEGLQQLYSKQSTSARRWSSLYSTLKDTKINFLVLSLSAALIRRAIVGFVQKSGLAQNILLIIFESAMCIGECLDSLIFFCANEEHKVLFKYKPYYSEGYNRLNYALAGVNVFSHLLILPFNNVIHLKVLDCKHVFQPFSLLIFPAARVRTGTRHCAHCVTLSGGLRFGRFNSDQVRWVQCICCIALLPLTFTGFQDGGYCGTSPSILHSKARNRSGSFGVARLPLL